MTHPKALAAAKNLGLDILEYKGFFDELEVVIKSLLEEAKTALLNHNDLKAVEAIHSIKGSVASLGLTASHHFCINLENDYKKGTNEKSMVLLKEFITIYTNEFNEIRQAF